MDAGVTSGSLWLVLQGFGRERAAARVHGRGARLRVCRARGLGDWGTGGGGEGCCYCCSQMLLAALHKMQPPLTLQPNRAAAADLSTSNVPRYTALAGVLRRIVAPRPCGEGWGCTSRAA